VAGELEGVGGMYFNNCCRCQPSDAGVDAKLAHKLWEVSEVMLLTRVGVGSLIS
jgi:WW domain-containing oxidoreductase